MKNLKNKILILLTTIILICMCSRVVRANYDMTTTINTVDSAKIGETIDVIVGISGTSAGVRAIQGTLEYDKNVLENTAKEVLMNGWTELRYNDDNGVFIAEIGDNTGNEGWVTTNKEIVKFTFKVKSTASLGTTMIHVKNVNGSEVGYNSVYASDARSGITISESNGGDSTETSVTGIRLNVSNVTMNPGDVKTLIYTITPTTATNKKVTWTSSDENVATVDLNGKVTAIAKGTAIITVTTEDGTYTASCKINVIEKNKPGNTDEGNKPGDGSEENKPGDTDKGNDKKDHEAGKTTSSAAGDNTTANSYLPKAGESIVLIALGISLLAGVIFLVRRYKKMKMN